MWLSISFFLFISAHSFAYFSSRFFHIGRKFMSFVSKQPRFQMAMVVHAASLFLLSDLLPLCHCRWYEWCDIDMESINIRRLKYQSILSNSHLHYFTRFGCFCVCVFFRTSNNTESNLQPTLQSFSIFVVVEIST